MDNRAFFRPSRQDRRVTGQHHRVAVAVFVRGDSLLLCHRHPGRRWYPNVWDVPGGHIDADESPVEALRRELLEELGVVVRSVNTKPFRVYEPVADLTVHAWVVTQWEGEIANLAPEEHDDIAWFRIDEIASLDLADEALGGLLLDALAEP